jgi:hypothetical protein
METDKNRQICRFLAEMQIRIRGYDMVLVGLILNLTENSTNDKQHQT